MGSLERRRDRARQVSDRLRSEIGRDFRKTRSALDLSLEAVGRDAGLSRAQVGRIELGRHRHVALEDLVAVGTVLGLDVSVRAFPGGAPLRDVAHLSLLERFRPILHPSLSWAVEVPVMAADPADRRAWDAMIRGGAWRIGVEAETRVRDAQELERRCALKSRDGNVDHMVLLLSDTRWNRRAIRAAGVGLSEQFPLRTSAVLSALQAGRDPGSNGIVLL